MTLTQATINRLCTAGPKVRMHSLGKGANGLILRVTKQGSGSWVQRIQTNGVRRDLNLGPCHSVTLSDATKTAQTNQARRLLGLACDTYRETQVRTALGLGPMDALPVGATVAQPSTPLFADFASQVIRERMESGHWKRQRQATDWQGSLDRWCKGIARTPLDTIKRSDILAVMEQPVASGTLWTTHHATAKTVLQRLGSVLDVAVARELVPSNPVDAKAIATALGKVRSAVQHHRAMGWQALPGFLATLKPHKVTAHCARFVALTACRINEATNATWSEIDLDAATWTIPGERMKAGKSHTVMLSTQAVALLQGMARTGEYVFARANGKPVATRSLAYLFEGSEGTAHGMRSDFRNWCADTQPHVPGEVAEMCLAHSVGNAVTQAYLRTKMDSQRRSLMQAWADHLAS